jgi:two-component system, NtrC family, response regulator HydG
MDSNRPGSILLADDDVSVIRLLELRVQSWGYRTRSALHKGDLLCRLTEEVPRVLVLDLQFGLHHGLDVLRQVLDVYPRIQVLMLTSHGSIETAVQAMKLGARDFLTKPPDWARLRTLLDTITKETPQTVHTHRALPKAAQGPALLGESPQMQTLRQQISEIARTGATVLLLGESGTGKELVARMLHEQSNRSAGPFVPVNMAALPRELSESVLFGHEKGAFSGADQQRNGCCEAADQGTLFLDEIGEMELCLQAKLLRFVQERTVQRVGSAVERPVNVRLVAATNRDLRERVAQGQFRQDLFYRLDVIPLRLPPLRERGTDVLTLTEHFLRSFAEQYQRPLMTLTPHAQAALLKYTWPGNVRELVNVVERLVILERGPEVRPEALPFTLSSAQVPCSTAASGASETDKVAPVRMNDLERGAILDALRQHGGNVREAAKMLGIGQATVYRKIKLYGIRLETAVRVPQVSD